MKKFKKVYIEITNVCNLACKFCPQSKRKKEFISVEDFKLVIDEAKDYTDMVCLHVKGEPLLHPNLEEILNVCEDNNISVNITTNATLLLKNINIILNSKSVRQLNLSLHSISQNEFDKDKYLCDIIKSVRLINNNTNIFISYRLWNLSDIKLNDKNKFIIDRLSKEYNIDNLLELAKENKFVKLKENIFLNQDIEFVWPSLNLDIIDTKGKCMALKHQLAVLVNLDVVPCCLDQEGDIKLGNLKEERLNDILNKDITNKIIKGFENQNLVHPLCQRCEFRTKFNDKK
jgi:radical SAM protein with 4Fe4S-binding SPASM domain